MTVSKTVDEGSIPSAFVFRGQADIGLLHRFAKAGRVKPVRVQFSRPLLYLWINAPIGVYKAYKPIKERV
jgi:hypothetical protein